MTRNDATVIARALTNIEDFEMFMELVEHAFYEAEGNFNDFYYDELLPLMKKELRRRENVLEDMAMPKVSKASITPEPSPSLLASVQGQASRAMLEKTYHCTSSFCCGCGTHLSTDWGEPLGRYFVMDNNGRFYCANCDKQFEDNDERIYVSEEDMV